jgi:hypothetical protein
MAIAQGELYDTDLATLYLRFLAGTPEPDHSPNSLSQVITGY